ncbi:hypothetical protein SGPA1_20199 [Streptomyces misionensis JCM 4497]
MLLHHAHQGAVEPEVRRSEPPLRRRQGGPAHRRQQRQLRRPGGRDDHRGAPEHAVRGLADAPGPRVRGHGRGALPLRPLPRRRLGGGDHPSARLGDPGVPVGDRVQRGGVRRLAGHRPGRHRGDRLRAPARAAVPARARRTPDIRPVRGGRGPQEGRQPRSGAPRPDGGDPALVPGPAPGPGHAGGRPGARAPAALAGVDAGPPRGHRAAGRRGPAARDHLHLQPCRLRGRRPAVPVRGPAAQRRGGTGTGPRPGRGAHRPHRPRGPARPRLLRVARGPGAGHRRPPRGHAADLQGGRGGTVRARPGQGRVRDRDPRARHQHARPLGGPGETRQVERRAARRHHPGRVHPADRAGRPPGHRRRGPRRRAVAARHEPRAPGRARGHPYLPAALQLPALVQHGGQPGRAVRPAPLPGTAGDVVRAVPGGPFGGRDLPAGAAQRGGTGRLQGLHDLPPRRLRGVRAAAPGAEGPGDRAGPAGRPPAPRRGRRRPGEAAPGRRHPRADGQVRGPRAGAGPGAAGRPLQRAPRVRPPGRTAPAGADRRTAGQAAGVDGLPGAGRAAGPDADPQVLQPALAAVAPGPRLRAAHQGRAHPPGAGPQKALAGRRRPGDRPAAHRDPRPPLPRLQRAGGPRPLGRALPPAAAGHLAAGAQDRGPHEHHRADLRPDRRPVDRAGLPARQRGHRARPAPRAAVRRAGPAGQRVPARGRLGGAGARRTGRLRLGAGLRGPGRRRRAGAQAALRQGEGRAGGDGADLGPAGRSGGGVPDQPDRGRRPARAGPGLRLGRLHVGVGQGPGRGAARGGDAGGRLRALVQAGHRCAGADLRGGPRGRLDRGQGRAEGRRPAAAGRGGLLVGGLTGTSPDDTKTGSSLGVGRFSYARTS